MGLSEVLVYGSMLRVELGIYYKSGILLMDVEVGIVFERLSGVKGRHRKAIIYIHQLVKW
jgi:hypothetical protein